jgi:cyclopropane fatty-acyl-phospholipid synthase-like methyltransferase
LNLQDEGEEDWMSRTFFTGGTMASASLLLYFQDDVSILNQWYVNGKHYAQTSEEWLKKLDRELRTIRPIFAKAYGEADVNKWIANWRTFFIAVAELFGYNNGEEWGVSHYLFKKK